MASIPNYSSQVVNIEPPEAEVARTANVTTVEANMVFGSYNANSPALSYMYKALGNTLEQGAGLVNDMANLALKKIEYERTEELRKAKFEYENMIKQAEVSALIAPQVGSGSLLPVPDSVRFNFGGSL